MIAPISDGTLNVVSVMYSIVTMPQKVAGNARITTSGSPRDAASELPRDVQILDAVIADGPHVDLSRHPEIQDLGDHVGSLKIEGVFRKGCRRR
jgi:hypothetical protein